MRKSMSILAGIALAGTLSACSSGASNEPESTDTLPETEVQSSISETVTLESIGSTLVNPDDPENLEVANACAQMERNFEVLDPTMDELDARMEALEDADSDSEEVKSIQSEYLSVYRSAIAGVGNEEVVTAWIDNADALESVFEAIDANDVNVLDSVYAVFEETSAEYLRVCSQ